MEPYTWNNVKLKNAKWGVQWFKLQNDQFSGHYPSLLSFETESSLQNITSKIMIDNNHKIDHSINIASSS
jgi:hypothetical protein